MTRRLLVLLLAAALPADGWAALSRGLAAARPGSGVPAVPALPALAVAAPSLPPALPGVLPSLPASEVPQAVPEAVPQAAAQPAPQAAFGGAPEPDEPEESSAQEAGRLFDSAPPSRARRAARLAARWTGASAVWTLLRYGGVEKSADAVLDLRLPAARRKAAAEHLARMNRPEPIEALAEAATRDPEPEVRRAAREALLSITLSWMKTLYEEAAFHPLAARRVSALKALGAQARFSSAEATVDRLAYSAAMDLNSDARLFAVEALAQARSPKALKALRDLRRQSEVVSRPEELSALELAISEVEARYAARGVQTLAFLRQPVDVARARQPLHHGALKRVIAISAVFTAVEAIGSMFTGSVSLKADAMHLASDLAINVGALAAIYVARRPPNSRKTYGYLKTEPIVGLLSSLLIGALALWTGWEAFGRLYHPEAVSPWSTMLLALGGLTANAASTLLLYRYKEDSLTLKSAFLHSAADAIGSVGIIVGSLLIAALGWLWADPAISFLIVGLILHTTFGLAKRSWNVLIDSVPDGVDLSEVERSLLAIPGVAAVHDLHAWSLNSTENAATVSLFIKPEAAHEDVLAAAVKILGAAGLKKTTVQVQRLP